MAVNYTKQTEIVSPLREGGCQVARLTGPCCSSAGAICGWVLLLPVGTHGHALRCLSQSSASVVACPQSPQDAW